MKKTLPLVAIAVGLVCCSAINAKETEQAQPQVNTVHDKVEHTYLGVRAGWGTFNDGCESRPLSCGGDDSLVGLGVYGGYQLNEWLALEAGYTGFEAPDAGSGSGPIEADVRMIDLTGVVRHQFNQDWSVYGRLGVSYVMLGKQADREGGATNEWEALAAIGVGYALSPQWSLRTEIQYSDDLGKGHTVQAGPLFTTAGVVYHFKDASLAKPAPAPQLAPAAVSVPAPAVEAQRQVLHASTLFANASALLRPTPEFRNAVVAIIKSGASVRIVGHADSRGHEAFNQGLSELRAQAVANYFLWQGAIPARLQVEGRGESQPVADNLTEAGRAQNRRSQISVNARADSDTAQGG